MWNRRGQGVEVGVAVRVVVGVLVRVVVGVVVGKVLVVLDVVLHRWPARPHRPLSSASARPGKRWTGSLEYLHC